MQFDFTLNPYGAQQLDVKGKFFKYVRGTGTVRVTTDKGEAIDLLPGQGVWGVDYAWLSVKDRTGTNNAGTILAGAFDFHDDRISGTVDVVDGGRTRTLSNAAFLRLVGMAASAGVNATVQLWNPAGNTKNMMLESVLASSSAGGVCNVFASAAALTTTDSQGAPKLIGGTLSAAQLNKMNNSPSLANATGILMTGGYVGANQQVQFKFVEPIVIRPGSGLVVAGQVGQDITAAFEWFEESA